MNGNKKIEGEQMSDKVMIILWAIIGIMNLSSEEIDKISYGLMWIVLMIELITNYME